MLIVILRAGPADTNALGYFLNSRVFVFSGLNVVFAAHRILYGDRANNYRLPMSMRLDNIPRIVVAHLSSDVLIHRARTVDNEHDVKRLCNCGRSRSVRGRGESGEAHEEVVVAFHIYGSASKGAFRIGCAIGEDGLVGPDAPDVLGGCLALVHEDVIPRIKRGIVGCLGTLISRSVELDTVVGIRHGRIVGGLAREEAYDALIKMGYIPNPKEYGGRKKKGDVEFEDFLEDYLDKLGKERHDKNVARDEFKRSLDHFPTDEEWEEFDEDYDRKNAKRHQGRGSIMEDFVDEVEDDFFDGDDVIPF